MKPIRYSTPKAPKYVDEDALTIIETLKSRRRRGIPSKPKTGQAETKRKGLKKRHP